MFSCFFEDCAYKNSKYIIESIKVENLFHNFLNIYFHT